MLSTCKYKAIGLLDVDEKLKTVIIHMSSNDITKINYENVSAEDLAQEIVNIVKNIDCLVSTKMQFRLYC